MKDIYINKHIKCGKAIEEYNSYMDLLKSDIILSIEFEYNWLEKYDDLFQSSINKPSNLPWIHLSISDDYYNIKEFANLYSKVLNTFSL